MLIGHWDEIDPKDWRWENFSPKELACPCCGEAYFDEDALDKLQRTRDILGVPVRINSAHRCTLHNAKVGGAPQSQHLKIAFDLSLRTGIDPQTLFNACREGGLTTFGFYNSFLHTDTREPGRRWHAGKAAADLWRGIADIKL